MLNKFLLKGREVDGEDESGRKKGGEEEREEGCKWEEARGNHMRLGPAPTLVCNTCQVSSLHLVSRTASEAQLCVYSLITPHAAQRPRAGLELAHSLHVGPRKPAPLFTSSPRPRQGSVSKN